MTLSKKSYTDLHGAYTHMHNNMNILLFSGRENACGDCAGVCHVLVPSTPVFSADWFFPIFDNKLAAIRRNFVYARIFGHPLLGDEQQLCESAHIQLHESKFSGKEAYWSSPLLNSPKKSKSAWGWMDMSSETKTVLKSRAKTFRTNDQFKAANFTTV